MSSIARIHSLAAPRQRICMLQLQAGTRSSILPSFLARGIQSSSAVQASRPRAAIPPRGRSYRIPGARSFGTSRQLQYGQFVISSAQPSETTQDGVLEEVEKLNEQSKIAEAENAAMVILATPAFAGWLEASGEFLPRVLGKIFPDVMSPQVNILSAVVDALPSSSPDSPEQGIAVLSGDSEMLPGLFENTQKPSTKKEASISFVIPQADKSGRESLQMTVPLANTLFVNGKLSTLQASQWARDQVSGKFMTISQPLSKRSQVIHPPIINGLPEIIVPAVALTPPRQISAALGNIVRQIRDEDGKAVPASKELEAAVDRWFEFNGIPKQPVNVWALVVPEKIMKAYVKTGVILDPEADQFVQSWGKMLLEPERLGSILLNGSRFRRVLSGGGGWGQKAGLLSLDPDSQYSPAAESEDAFDAPLDTVDIFSSKADDISPFSGTAPTQASPLGVAASPGDYIQFFIDPVFGSPEATESNPEIETAKEESTKDVDGRVALVVGTIPPTVDAMPVQPASNAGGLMEPSLLSVHNGIFGALTQSAVYLQDDELVATKVSFPRSSMVWAFEVKKKRGGGLLWGLLAAEGLGSLFL